MSNSTSDTDNLIQVEIFPHRLLSSQTSQKLLTELQGLDGISRMVIHGPRLPLEVKSGPGTGEKVDHPDRQVIQVADTALELSVCFGRLWLEVANVDVKEEVRTVCKRVLPCIFDYKEGTFFHKKATVSDYAKFGPDVDPKILGLTDPKVKIDDQVCILSQTE